MRFSCSLLFILSLSACSQNIQQQADPAVKSAENVDSPDGNIQTASYSSSENVYQVKFETSKGDFILEVQRDLAPIGADHFKELVEENFYDNTRFFRVMPGFVVQFGMNGDPEVHKHWSKQTIKDEPVKATNAKGTVTFAKTSAPNSRSTQLFISLGNNARLDGMGFSPFGKIVKGMDVVESIHSGYGQKPDQGMIKSQGNDYLDQKYPKLDFIKRARIVKKEKKTEEK